MERAIIKKRKGDKQQHMYSMPYVMYDKQDRTEYLQIKLPLFEALFQQIVFPLSKSNLIRFSEYLIK